MDTFSQLSDLNKILFADWTRPKFRFNDDTMHVTLVLKHIRGLDTAKIQWT